MKSIPEMGNSKVNIISLELTEYYFRSFIGVEPIAAVTMCLWTEREPSLSRTCSFIASHWYVSVDCVNEDVACLRTTNTYFRSPWFKPESSNTAAAFCKPVYLGPYD
jgi:hypothetical protein